MNSEELNIFDDILKRTIEEEYKKYTTNISLIYYYQQNNIDLRKKLKYSLLNFNDMNNIINKLNQLNNLIRIYINFLNNKEITDYDKSKIQLLLNKFSCENLKLLNELDYLNDDNLRLQIEIERIKRKRFI